ncbi:MAG TPA: DUF4190 domain-containing protein, partial [Acidimicrobiales bacterium]|nr:DUF4190 domain-containing protein [Acidimicrobiales bacterium]
MSPQPRPRRKDRDEATEDEVLTPDVVSGPDGDDVPPLPPARPDRRPLWALIAGLSAVWFALLGSILSFLLAPVAIALGLRAMRRIDEGEGDPKERRKAKIGMIAGIGAALFIVVQIVGFALFFEWDKTDEDLELQTEKPT